MTPIRILPAAVISLALVFSVAAVGQAPLPAAGPQSRPSAEAEPSVEEQQSLMQALSDGGTSPIDMIRALESHLSKFPQSTQHNEIELSLTRAAIDTNDLDRIIKYGERILKNVPDDVLL
ncbi:MAG: hypothetical protein ABI995_11820, partial [Acidobacteriota bacterium]